MLPLGSITEQQYDDTFNNNVKGVLFTVQKALPLLAKGASVIVTSSTTSIKGTPNFSVYSASKAAVRNFVRSWISDVKDRGIRINAISPGSTHTPVSSISPVRKPPSNRVCSPTLPARFRSAAWPSRKKLRRRCCFSPATIQASSTAPNSLSTVDRHRSDPVALLAKGMHPRVPLVYLPLQSSTR